MAKKKNAPVDRKARAAEREDRMARAADRIRGKGDAAPAKSSKGPTVLDAVPPSPSAGPVPALADAPAQRTFSRSGVVTRKSSNRPYSSAPAEVAPAGQSSSSASMDDGSTKGQRSRQLIREAQATPVQGKNKRKVKAPKPRVTTEERIAAARSQPGVRGLQALDTSRAQDSELTNTVIKLALEQEGDPSGDTMVSRARALSDPYKELQYNELTDVEKGHLIGDISAGVLEHRNLSEQLSKSAASIRGLSPKSEAEDAENRRAATTLEGKATEASSAAEREMQRGVEFLRQRQGNVIRANAPREGANRSKGRRTLIARVPQGYDLKGSVQSEKSGDPRVRFLTQNAEAAAKARANVNSINYVERSDVPMEVGNYVEPSASELASGKVITRRKQKTVAKRKERESERLAEASALEKAGNKAAADKIRQNVAAGSEANTKTEVKPVKTARSKEIAFSVEPAPADMIPSGGDAARVSNILRNQLGLRHATPGRVGETMRAVEQQRSELKALQEEPPLGVSGTLVERGGDVRAPVRFDPYRSASDLVEPASQSVGLGQLHADLVSKIGGLKDQRKKLRDELSALGESDYGGEAHSAKMEEYNKLSSEQLKLTKELKTARDSVRAATKKGTKLVAQKVSPEAMATIAPLNSDLKLTGQGQFPQPKTTTALPESMGVDSGVSAAPRKSVLQGQLFSTYRSDAAYFRNVTSKQPVSGPEPTPTVYSPPEGYQRTIFDAMADQYREANNPPEQSTLGAGRPRRTPKAPL